MEVSLENPFSADYKDTVLVGTNAQLKVRLTDEDGKPVANTEVVLTSKALDDSNNQMAGLSYAFRNLSDSAKRTDADGYVTFVYGLGITHDQYNKPIDATRTEYVSSYKLTASVANGAQASTDVKFGAIKSERLTEVDVLNNNADKKGYTAVAPTDADDIQLPFVSLTHGRAEKRVPVEYVSSQQVSNNGSQDHKVGITTGVPELVLPGAKTTEPTNLNETVTFETEKYSTHEMKKWGRAIGKTKASDLQYATVNFGKLSLSKYSRFVVQAYIVTDANNPTAPGTYTQIPVEGGKASYQVAGEKVSGDFAVQIPIKENAPDGFLYVTALVESKGQVNTDVNEGFTVKNVTGVHRKGVVKGETKPLKDVTVEWAKDTEATYTLEQPLTGNIYTYLKGLYTAVDPKNEYTYLYKVPAFPRTGNAIIRVLDSQKKVVDYYAVPTENEENTSTSILYNNRNILKDDEDLVHRISEQEAINLNAGTVTSKAVGDLSVAEVDSNQSGITHVVGTLKSDNPEIVIDATNAKVYSSVHWNPVKAGVAPSNHARGAAIVGQSIVLKAQLLDGNGNPVTTKDVPVQFLRGNQLIHGTDKTVGNANLVHVDTQTNAQGQAELVLSSTKKVSVAQIAAQLGSGGTGYQLAYVLDDKPVSAPHVDLYWLDANLSFEPDANTIEKITTSDATPTVVVGNGKVHPTVNEHWAYQVRTSGDFELFDACDLARYANVEIAGLNIQTTVGTGSKGTVTDNANGKANVTSTAAGTTHLVNVLNNSSITKDVTFKATGSGLPDITLNYVGTGVPTLNKKMTLDVEWGAGIPTAEFIMPSVVNNRAELTNAQTDGVKVYVRVQDANGNVLTGKSVTMEITGTTGQFKGGTDTKKTVTTDANGIAAYEIQATSGATAGEGVTLKVVADGISQYFDYPLQWTNPVVNKAPFKVKGNNGDIGYTTFNHNDGTIKLTFENDIYAPSVIKEQFTVKYGNLTDGMVEQTVTDVEVANNVVTLKIPGLKDFNETKWFTVDIANGDTEKVPSDGIQYKITSVDYENIKDEYKTIGFTVKGMLVDPATGTK